MPVKLRSSDLETASSRLRLKPRKAPYRVRIGNGVALGYRRTEASFGTWSAIVADGGGGEQLKKFGDADDREPSNGKNILSFDEAMTQARKLARGEDETAQTQSLLTLDKALTDYGDALKARGARAYNASLPRYHLSDAMLSKPVSLFTEDELTSWRGGLLKKGLAPSSVNRIMNSLRAALTLADKSRVLIWRAGLQALPDATEANNIVIEDEATAQAWVAASYAHGHYLGLLTHVLGESGARPSQASRLRVRDLIVVDAKAPRLMMPKSGKGGTRHPEQRKIERYPVSISPELAALLKTAAKGRPSNAALLLGKDGQPWSDPPGNDYRRDVRSVVKSIGLDPDVYGLYAFRHTSITRMLVEGTHTAIVAKAHDTSEAMIRKHYAALILDHTDSITRKTLPSLGPALQPAASNVVKLTR
jgi:integrase